MERIAIVTDSSCDASSQELSALNVRCVDLKIIAADGSTFEVSNNPEALDEFYDYIETCEELPTTSMPSPLQFGELYSQLAAEGYTSIISIHLSSALSGTSTAARMAAQTASIPVEVVDSLTATWPLWLIIRHACKLRDAGVNTYAITQQLNEMRDKFRVYFTLSTLRNLVMGGRAGKATGLAASLLDIKPLLKVDTDGQVGQMGKVKSIKRAVPKIAANIKEFYDEYGPLEGYMLHIRRPELVDELRKELDALGVEFHELGIRQIGPLIATYVSTGAVGAAFLPRNL